ncbi:ABC-2 family transporter protein [Novipirellula artificiosorum]|uniref:ABC-2 family transporter protein n=2 Tax=Novipirellula artificiosorum TaxID=2528016 RepID=A0A5C6DCV9_9BACT|nr:ABC-2 family transporter protein [Novipirellula artificiosorum]
MMFTSLPVGQMAPWLPTWLTPIWVLSIGLILGLILSAVVFGVLAALSLIKPLGHLADNPRAGVTASLVVGGLIAAALCTTYIPLSGEYSGVMFLPLICIGLVLGFGIIYGMWHRTRVEWFAMLSEGVIPYLLSTAGLFALIGLASTPLVEDPRSILESIAAVNIVGDGTSKIEVPVPSSPDMPGSESPFHPANIDYHFRNVSELTIESDRTIVLGDAAEPAGFSRNPVRVNEGEPLTYRYQDRDAPPVPSDPTRLHIQNREIDPATVVFTFKNQPLVPQASSIVWVAAAFFLLITSMMAFRQAAPRVWAIALSTAKNEMAQPLYLLLLALGLFGVLLFGIYPFNTLGDDIRLLKDSGVTLIMVLGMILAVWSAGTSVSDEIEGRTALTVLSKPVSRRAFILGKYAGIMLAVLVLFVILSAVLSVVISYKPIYDARENASAATTWQIGHEEIMTTLPVIGLYFMETMVIGAVAVALATRLPLLANFITCFMIYVIGNLTSPLVASARDNNELVGFVGKLIAVVIPNLNVFNVQSAVDAGNPIPPIYLAGAFNYLLCFAFAIWMLAMLLFEDRDLA